VPALIASAALQAGAVAGYHLTRPPEPTVLVVRLGGEGSGQVLVTQDGRSAPLLRCASASCRIEVEPGTALRLIALPGADATFEGWQQIPGRPPVALQPWLGDPLAACLSDRLSSAELVARSLAGDALQCALTVDRTVRVEAVFGVQPTEAEIAFADLDAIDGVELPALRPPREEIDAEKLDEAALEVAVVPPPPDQAVPPPPPPPPEEARPEEKTEKEPPPPIPQDMRMVEVPDKNEVEDEPDDATHLSDKNRDVAEETAATETNLEKEAEGEAKASVESPDTTSPEVGGPEDDIAQLEISEATSTEREVETDRSGESDEAKGVIKGEAGDNGDGGDGTDPGLLSMRGIQGRGSLPEQADGKKPGAKGKRGIKTQLDIEDYERIVGKDKVDDERATAQRRMSAKRGRWEKKMAAIKSALENFTPDVRPGNQTALKTRAHPFAVYVARMHRRIHELWGFGFLEDLDSKGSSHPMNDMELVVVIEMSINPNGTVHKTSIAKTSGQLTFDVAALDTVITSGPYEETPEKIRSVDQRVYLRWAFYRNWRQCGTFNVEPYILTEIPGGIEPLDDAATGGGRPKVTTATLTPGRGEVAETAPRSTVKDSAALYAANQWVSGYANADLDKLVRFSAVPFRAGEVIAAENGPSLRQMYEGLIVESGPMKDWALLTPAEYEKRVGAEVPVHDDSLFLVLRTAKESFALVMAKTKSGEYRATQLAR
jgi:TonB family protein